MPYDREKQAIRNREYYVSHREEVLARSAARYAAYREDKREERRARSAAYLATDSGYARQRAGNSRVGARTRGAVLDPELTNAVLAQILRDHNDCDWCEKPVSLRERMIDHKRAIHFGGEHTEFNIQILCKPCEKQKTNAEKSLIMRLATGPTQSGFVLAA